MIELSLASCKTNVLINIKGLGIKGTRPFSSASAALASDNFLYTFTVSNIFRFRGNSGKLSYGLSLL